MKGKFTVRILTKRLNYTLNLERNLTIIQGDSATGKSYMCELIWTNEISRSSNLKVEVLDEFGKKIKVRCVCLQNTRDWKLRLSQIHNSIVFLDEDCAFVKTKEFAKQVKGNTNYFVIVNRHLSQLYNLSFGVKAIYTMHTEQKYTHLQKKVTSNTIIPLYSKKPIYNTKPCVIDKIVTEDTCTGLEFFKSFCGSDVRPVQQGKLKENVKGQLGGKNKVCGDICSHTIKTPTLYVVDGAAFGCEIDKVIMKMYTNSNIILCLFESFEWFLLHSLLFTHNKQVKEILATPYRFIESSEYISWEEYFTDVLKQVCAMYNIKYSKNIKLNKQFITQQNIRHLCEYFNNSGVSFQKWL